MKSGKGLVKSRLVRWLIRILVAFILFCTLVLSVAIFTPVPDEVAWSTLEKAVRSAGGTVEAHREGSLISGEDLRDVVVKVPGKFEFRARRVHFRLSPWALVIGVVRLRDVHVEFPELLLAPGPAESEGAPYRNPSWLRLWIPKFRVEGGRVADLPPSEGGAPSGAWENIQAIGSLSLQGQTIRMTLLTLTAAPPPPIPGPVGARGSLSFELGRGGKADLRLRAGRSKVGVQGRVRLREGKLRDFEGDLELKRFSLREMLGEFEGLPDLTLDGKMELEGDGDGLAWRGEVEAPPWGTAATDGTLRWEGGTLSVAADASTPGFNLLPIWNPSPDKLILGRGSGRFTLESSPGKPARWEATATVRDTVFMDVPVSEATLAHRGEGAVGTITGTFVSTLSGPGTLRVAWDTDPGTWSVEATGASVSLPEILRNWEIGILSPPPQPLTVPPGTWVAHRVLLSGTPSTLSVEAEGRDPTGGEVSFRSAPFQESGPVSWNLAAHGMDPAAWGLGPHGSIQAQARFTGPAWERGLLSFQFGEGIWGDVRYKPFSADLHMAPDLLELEPCAVDTTAGRGRASGSLRDGSEIEADLEASVPDIALLKPFFGREDIRGSLEARAHLSGPVAHPLLRGSATAKRASLGGLTAGSASAEGTLDLHGKSADLSLRWLDFVSGEIPLGDGSATLRGPFSETRIHLGTGVGEGRTLALDARGELGADSGNLRLTGGRIDLEGKTFLQEGEAVLSWDSSAAALSHVLLKRKDSSLAFSGRMGLGAADPPISGTLTARHIPLRLFPIPSTAGIPSGFIEADLAWSGTLDRPSLSGTGSIEEGSYRYPRSDLAIEPVVLKWRAKGDRLVLTEATATTPEGGRATGSGSVLFRGFLPAGFDLKAVGRNFPFLLGTDVQGRCDFEVALTGTPTDPLLNGSARVLKGKIQLPEVVRQEPLPSTIRFVGGPAEASPEAPEEVSPQRLGGLLRLESDGKLWVSNRNLLAELAGALDVAFTPLGPTVAGHLEVVEGRYLFRGRKFDLRDSRIFFGGTTDLTPKVDIRALYTAGEVEVTVHLTGDPAKPNLGLSSSPPMPREDILSLILFGTPASELTNIQKQTSERSAAALAQQYGTIPLAGPLGQSLGLDSVEVGTSSVGFSKYVGDRLVVEYRQIFGALPEQRINFRYRINRRWSFETQISDAGRSGADILWEKRY